MWTDGTVTQLALQVFDLLSGRDLHLNLRLLVIVLFRPARSHDGPSGGMGRAGLHPGIL